MSPLSIALCRPLNLCERQLSKEILIYQLVSFLGIRSIVANKFFTKTKIFTC